jgi:hypothetical protein
MTSTQESSLTIALLHYSSIPLVLIQPLSRECNDNYQHDPSCFEEQTPSSPHRYRRNLTQFKMEPFRAL